MAGKIGPKGIQGERGARGLTGPSGPAGILRINECSTIREGEIILLHYSYKIQTVYMCACMYRNDEIQQENEGGRVL